MLIEESSRSYKTIEIFPSILHIFGLLKIRRMFMFI